MIIGDARMRLMSLMKVRLASKSTSILMPILSMFSSRFSAYTWTVIGRTIYYPCAVIDPLDGAYYEDMQKALVRVQQYRDTLGQDCPQWAMILCAPFLSILAWLRRP